MTAKAEPNVSPNVDRATIDSFSDEWSRFDQSQLPASERERSFNEYFSIFPWHLLSPAAEGFDMGCGSGRWALHASPRVGRLNCIDPSEAALQVARRNLASCGNVHFICASTDKIPLERESQDFGYALGVLHHIPCTADAMRNCVELLKPGAPFLAYLYYRFDNRPAWFRMIWHVSNFMRSRICILPKQLKFIATDIIALVVYLPLSRFAALVERLGLSNQHIPLRYYARRSFYTIRTDSRDRFGTPLERRFTRAEIEIMMGAAGLTQIRFADHEPFWCAVGLKKE